MTYVYVLFIEQVSGGEVIRQSTDVYWIEEQARDVMKAFVADEIKFIEKQGWTLGCDKETSFEAYEDGYYAMNHTFVEVRKEEVKGQID